MMKRLKSRDGFSLVECVITLAVITIVSAAAITITKNALIVAAKNNAQEEVRNLAENALEYYKWNPEKRDYFAEGEGWSANKDDEENYIYTYQNNYYTLTVSFARSATNPEDDTPDYKTVSFSAKAFNTTKNSEILFEVKEYGGGKIES